MDHLKLGLYFDLFLRYSYKLNLVFMIFYRGQKLFFDLDRLSIYFLHHQIYSSFFDDERVFES